MIFDKYKVFSFDCYGTLVDWEQSIIRELQSPLRTCGIDKSDIEVFKGFLDIEGDILSKNPSIAYPDALASAYERFFLQQKVPISPDSAVAFGGSVGQWSLFPDAAPALKLFAETKKLVVLSNIDNASIAQSTQYMNVDFFKIYTAEEIGSYKPDQKNFRYMLSKLEKEGFKRQEILHVSVSLYHDHIPALALGIDTCWINRANNENGTLAIPVEFSSSAAVKPAYSFPNFQSMLVDYKKTTRS